MTLPILLSVPHAGLRVPPEAKPYSRLKRAEIVADGDEGAAEIYDLKDHPVIGQLLDRYYRPYHRRLSTGVPTEIRLCVDCHTMAAVGPPNGPDEGEVRPHICLGNGNGDEKGTLTLPRGWTGRLLGCFREVFGDAVTTNEPFSGGYITRFHGKERPWLQLEISRAPFTSNAEKRSGVLRALTDFCDQVFS
jgi:formiminoglutamase